MDPFSNEKIGVFCTDDELDDEDGYPTRTTIEQKRVESSLHTYFRAYSERKQLDSEQPVLNRLQHKSFLKKNLTVLTTSYEALDCSRPWLLYWNLHSLALLGESLEVDDLSNIAKFIDKCQSPEGGFGGGPGQYPHLACTYAAVNALCTIGTEEAFNIIKREKLQEFLWSVRQPNGSFALHIGGEVDLRGIYCALSVAKLTNIYTPELFESSAEWIVSCQSYEGGFAACPGTEAHGGYSFCALAALFMLRQEHICDMQAFLRWITRRQMKVGGGFQGRTNKLLDSCYSFWQGGSFPILQSTLPNESADLEHWLFDEEALQEYILVCCQFNGGGLIDKPGKPRDLYHTCYSLSGLSVAQHSPFRKHVLGPSENELMPIHPVHNITMSAADESLRYFEKLPIPQTK